MCYCCNYTFVRWGCDWIQHNGKIVKEIKKIYYHTILPYHITTPYREHLGTGSPRSNSSLSSDTSLTPNSKTKPVRAQELQTFGDIPLVYPWYMTCTRHSTQTPSANATSWKLSPRPFGRLFSLRFVCDVSQRLDSLHYSSSWRSGFCFKQGCIFLCA